MLRIIETIKSLIRVIGSAFYRFYWDDCFSRASSLSYTSLFALVPITALSFKFGVFGVDEDQLNKTFQTIIDQVLPPIQDNSELINLKQQLIEYLNLFNQNVHALNTISIAVLICSGIALLNTIESALNVVWRVSSVLTIMSKIISFWAVITLGPLLIAVSFYWYTKVGAIAENYPWISANVLSIVNFLVPVAATWLAVTLMFYKLPAAKVRLWDASLGAFFSAVMFELVKRAFAYYVSMSTTYSKIYGVLTSIPLFLFWLYITWVVVLLGAEISYQSGSIKILRGLRKYRTDLGEIGAILGLRILSCIVRNFLEGKSPPTESEIALETGSDPVRLRTCLDILTDAKILTVVDQESHSRSLVLSPEKLKVGDIINTFRAKEHRIPLIVEPGERHEEAFLETIRQASLRIDRNRCVENWTLKELVTG